MPRIRTIKPDFWQDEDLADLACEVRLFYAGLWTQADKEGRLEDRPERLKVMLMPYDRDFDAEAALAVLAKPKRVSGKPYILRYEVGGEKFIQILSWHKHQRPHSTERESSIPPSPSQTLPKRREEGKERKGAATLNNRPQNVKKRLFNGYRGNPPIFNKLPFNIQQKISTLWAQKNELLKMRQKAKHHPSGCYFPGDGSSLKADAIKAKIQAVNNEIKQTFEACK